MRAFLLASTRARHFALGMMRVTLVLVVLPPCAARCQYYGKRLATCLRTTIKCDVMRVVSSSSLISGVNPPPA